MLQLALLLPLIAAGGPAVPGPSADDLAALPLLQDSPVECQNALWGEVPKERQLTGRKVILADIRGPAVITMIHFAMPESLKLDRGSVLRIWWDDEKTPSVEVPLVDFFCDPNGTQERVDSALVNKRRGWNAYFPMPFRKHAVLELEHDGPGPASCYFYVFSRPLKQWNPALGYFHSTWRQEKLLLGKRDYPALEARGKGQFVGWNATVRGVPPGGDGYPVDENAKFYVDGERKPSVELMGLEDAFGFSFGFPETANSFPYTGWAPFYKGACAYRFFVHEAIPFQRNLRVAIGFGEHEWPMFLEWFGKPSGTLEFSTCCYWYQTEPHAPFPPLPRHRARRPSLDADQQKALDALAEPARKAGLALQCYLGDPAREEAYIADGYDFVLDDGYRFNDTQNLWKDSAIKHCWASFDTLKMTLVTPKAVAGKLRLLLVDGDNFGGGRRETIFVAGRNVGTFGDFQKGKWVEVDLTAADTAKGEVPIRIENARQGANVVVSIAEFKPQTPQ
jgi:hypothetical protein